MGWPAALKNGTRVRPELRIVMFVVTPERLPINRTFPLVRFPHSRNISFTVVTFAVFMSGTDLRLEQL